MEHRCVIESMLQGRKFGTAVVKVTLSVVDVKR
jgi:hypothetical protein